MKSDFNEFENMQPVSPPHTLSETILTKVKSDLYPSPLLVFSKLSMVHFFVGALTLAICPQFGFKIFGSGMGLMNYFMDLGRVGCPMACGFFFLGSSLFVAAFVLRQEELSVVRKNWLVQLMGLSLLSLGFFIMLNPEVLILYAAVWLFGSVSGGLAIMEIIWRLRLKQMHSS